MRRVNRAGFSLIELLVVIATVTVLSGIVLPAIGRTRSTAREVYCANNLRHIGEAFISKKSDEDSWAKESMGLYRWVDDLLPYADGSEQLFLCPEDDEPAYLALSRTRLSCYRGRYRGENKGKKWLFDFELRAMAGWVQRHDLDDHSYELWFEDQVDGDYNDVKLKVAKLADGKVTISTVSRAAAYHFDLIELPDRKTLMARIGEEDGWRDPCTVSGALTSYGRNAFAERIDPAASSIVALDYELAIADCGGVDASNDWSQWRQDDGTHAFTRHNDAANVLFADGHVERMYSNDINPAYLAAAESIWCP